jgi:hypothetical protein
VAYLPKDTDLLTFWPEAIDIDSENVAEISYSERFPKPDWYK